MEGGGPGGGGISSRKMVVEMDGGCNSGDRWWLIGGDGMVEETKG